MRRLRRLKVQGVIKMSIVKLSVDEATIIKTGLIAIASSLFFLIIFLLLNPDFVNFITP